MRGIITKARKREYGDNVGDIIDISIIDKPFNLSKNISHRYAPILCYKDSKHISFRDIHDDFINCYYKTPRLDNLRSDQKDDKGEYEYIATGKKEFLSLLNFLSDERMKWTDKTKIKFLDLGGGVGLIPHILKKYNLIDEAYNYDNEEVYINASKKFKNVNSRLIDFFKSKKEDFSNFNYIYMYEPVMSGLTKKWVRKMEVISVGTCIILNSAGMIYDHLIEDKKYYLMRSDGNLKIFLKIK